MNSVRVCLEKSGPLRAAFGVAMLTLSDELLLKCLVLQIQWTLQSSCDNGTQY